MPKSSDRRAVHESDGVELGNSDRTRRAVDDVEQLDALGARLGALTLLEHLVASVERPLRAEIDAGLPDDIHQASRWSVAETLTRGRPGLWVATGWLASRLGPIRVAPHPIHERWDALLELHRELPEAAWMVAALFQALGPNQDALARRIALGVRRRFGERGVEVVRGGAAAHAALLSG